VHCSKHRASPLAEWLYEAGIGEARAALVARDQIWKAEIELDGSGPREGTIVGARLIDRPSNLVQLDSGAQALCENVPRNVTQGARVLVRILREPIPELGRPKLARTTPAPEGAEPMEGPDLLARILASDHPVRRLQPHEPDLLEHAGWSELLEEAASGEIGFAGGALRMSVTPAMTLFDVDGAPPLGALAVQAAHAVARTLERMGIGGSIGIDFPTLAGKAERQAVGEASGNGPGERDNTPETSERAGTGQASGAATDREVAGGVALEGRHDEVT